MKKFTFKGVLEGIRSTVSQSSNIKSDEGQDIVENLKPENFSISKTVRHGFPYQAICMDFDSIQHLLAIGTKTGHLKIFGCPGVDVDLKHTSDAAVLDIRFVTNAGSLISICSDDIIHSWNLKETPFSITCSLKFQRERITTCHLIFPSHWLYLGTDKGNVHIVNVDTLTLSGYVINWNKAIDLQQKTHPGCIVQLADCPTNSNKLLIGFELGLIVLWDLKGKIAEYRYYLLDNLKSICWHYDGRQFISSHCDGSLNTWNIRQSKPVSTQYPHAKINKNGKLDNCNPIYKVQWKESRNGDSFIIFFGGLLYEKTNRNTSMTIIDGKCTTILEMDNNIIDFLVLCESLWQHEIPEPYAVVVLLENDLVMIDLLSPGFLCFENPYPIDISESPVTFCYYLADCPSDIIPAYYSVGLKNQKKGSFSSREWPINGGQWGNSSSSYSEILITGHADGAVKFWDASAFLLQLLYKLRTVKFFEILRTKTSDIQEEELLSIVNICLCPESRLFCIANSSLCVILFRFKSHETIQEIRALEIPFLDCLAEVYSYSPESSLPGSAFPLNDIDNSSYIVKKQTSILKIKCGHLKMSPGYQIELLCFTPFNSYHRSPLLTSLNLNSLYGLLAYGSEQRLVVIDFIQRVCLINVNIADLYGSSDPFSRPVHSKRQLAETFSKEEDSKSYHEPFDDNSSNSNTNISKQSSGVLSSGGYGVAHSRRLQEGGPYSSLSMNRPSLQATSPRLKKCASLAIPSFDSNDFSSSPPSLPVTPPYTNSSIPWGNWTNVGERENNGVIAGGSKTCSAQIMKSYKNVLDKSESTVSHSRSSSFSSLENVNAEIISTLVFIDSYTKKDSSTYPTLWIGTSLGSVIVISFFLPTDAEERYCQPITAQTTGMIIRLKGIVLGMSFLDCNGALIPCPSESWKETKLEEKHSVCLLCYFSNGHILVYSLPSLRVLHNVEFLPLSCLSFQTKHKENMADPMLSIWGQQLFVYEDVEEIAKTFCFSNQGGGLYLCSPSEIQRFSVVSDISEMMCTLFVAKKNPDPPKENFLKNLFGGGNKFFDREELFGEEKSGKASKGVAKHVTVLNANLENIGVKTNVATGEISHTRNMLVERGERLGHLEERTGRMMSQAEDFASNSHLLMLKYKDKKWYKL